MWDSKPKLRGKAQTLHCVNTRAVLHVKRIPCVVKYMDSEKGEVSLECQLILNDLNPSGTAIYSPTLIPLGTALKFEFVYPRAMTLDAKIGWQQKLYDTGKVISDHRPRIRLGVLFIVKDMELEANLKLLCEDIAKLYPGIELTKAPYAAA